MLKYVQKGSSKEDIRSLFQNHVSPTSMEKSLWLITTGLLCLRQESSDVSQVMWEF